MGRTFHIFRSDNSAPIDLLGKLSGSHLPDGKVTAGSGSSKTRGGKGETYMVLTALLTTPPSKLSPPEIVVFFLRGY